MDLFKRFFGVFLLTAAAVVVFSAAGVPEAPPRPKSYGGTLVIGFDHRPAALNPILTNSSVSLSVLSLVFNPLVRYGPGGEMEPALASSWDVSPDGLVYTFRLRGNVRFHDGVGCTAKDAAFTYKKILDPASRSPYSNDLSNVETVEALDEHTLRFVLKKPNAAFLYQLQREIVPKHIYEGANLVTGNFNRFPVGTGPFKFKSWTNDDTITLEANLDYFEGRPHLDRVVYKIFTSPSETWSTLMRGEIDLVLFLKVEDYELTQSDSSFKVFSCPQPFYYAVFYNFNDPVFLDQKVRRAIAHAVDRKEIVHKLEKGHGVEALGPFYPLSPFFDSEADGVFYDPEKATRLLAEAGWSDSNFDGILEKEGKELMLRLIVDPRKEKMVKIAMMLRQQLQEVGVRIEIRLKGDDALPQPENGEAYLIQALGLGDPHEVVKILHSQDGRIESARAKLPSHEIVDRLIEAGPAARDPEERKNIYRHLGQRLREDQSVLFLYFPYLFHAISSEFEGAEGYLNVYMPDYRIKDIYLSEKREGVMRDGGNQ